MKVQKIAHFGRMKSYKNIQIGEVIDIDSDNCPKGFEVVSEPKPRAKKTQKKEKEAPTPSEENN